MFTYIFFGTIFIVINYLLINKFVFYNNVKVFHIHKLYADYFRIYANTIFQVFKNILLVDVFSFGIMYFLLKKIVYFKNVDLYFYAFIFTFLLQWILFSIAYFTAFKYGKYVKEL